MTPIPQGSRFNRTSTAFCSTCSSQPWSVGLSFPKRCKKVSRSASRPVFFNAVQYPITESSKSLHSVSMTGSHLSFTRGTAPGAIPQMILFRVRLNSGAASFAVASHSNTRTAVCCEAASRHCPSCNSPSRLNISGKKGGATAAPRYLHRGYRQSLLYPSAWELFLYFAPYFSAHRYSHIFLTIAAALLFGMQQAFREEAANAFSFHYPAPHLPPARLLLYRQSVRSIHLPNVRRPAAGFAGGFLMQQ